MHGSHLSEKPWLVQKYGGTSVAKQLEDITNIIIPSYLQTHRVAIVCSARSGTIKSTGTTSMLLEAIRQATTTASSVFGGSSPAERACKIIDAIEQDHLLAASGLVIQTPSTLLKDLQQGIHEDCEQLREFLAAISTIGEISERAQDHVLAAGEKLSCRIVEASLNAAGIAAKMVMLGGIVQEAYDQQSQDQKREAYRQHPANFLRNLAKAIEPRIRNCGDSVPVITGECFFGIMPESLIASVGRGYSDLCAALCSASIGAEELQIWKEVDGVFTADPIKVSSARLLATITAEEAVELSFYGSEVIHPLTLEQIGSAGIPLRLKNVKNPQANGTIIFPSPGSPPLTPITTLSNSSSFTPPENGLGTPRSVFMASNGYHGDEQRRRTPTAITSKDAITVINVQSNGRSSAQAFLGDIIKRLTRHNLMVNLTSSSRQSISFALSTGTSEADGRSVERAAAELEELGTVTIARHMSIVSIVGHKMRNMVGIAGEIFSALAGARVNIYLISQGASEINISLVVKAQDALLAVTVIHSNVLRIPLHSEQESNFIKGPWLY